MYTVQFSKQHQLTLLNKVKLLCLYNGDAVRLDINLAGTAQSVQRLATGWTVLWSNPGGGRIFRTRPARPWGSPSLL